MGIAKSRSPPAIREATLSLFFKRDLNEFLGQDILGSHQSKVSISVGYDLHVLGWLLGELVNHVLISLAL